MVKLLESTTGAKLVIASNDHCPPHVHAIHRAKGWVARFWFSFESEAVGLMSIAPTEILVRRRQLSQILREIASNLPACRTIWWEGKRATCLENRWMLVMSPNKIEMRDGRQAGAKQVKQATYDIETGATRVFFSDGTNHLIVPGSPS